MSHSCGALLCDTPHDCCDHKEECGCKHCHFDHVHDWRDWAIYPECEFCETEMMEYVQPFLDEIMGGSK